MTKKELAKEVANRTGYTQKDVSAVINSTFEAVADTVKTGDEVFIPGFGKFKLKNLAARQCINPQDRTQLIDVPTSKNIKFEPSSVIKKFMNA